VVEKLGEDRATGRVIVRLEGREYTTLCFLHDAVTGHTGSGRNWDSLFNLLEALRAVVNSICDAARDLAARKKEEE